jgi:integrase/recombinase XerC
VCEAIRATLVAAGLGAERGVRPASVRHWAGRAAFDAGAPIEKVAAMMGHRSLDETARDIGYLWRSPAGGAR